MKILLISGHGAGDSGAVGCGFKEADLTRQAANILEGKLKAYALTVSRYPSARDAYQDNKAGALAVSFSNYSLIVELHFNSFNGSANGTEVLYKPSSMKALAAKVSAAIASVGFYNRGAKQRTDLANMNKCAKLGVPYILVETCFIDNKADTKLYEANLYTVWNKVAAAICDYYGIKKNANAGGDAVLNGWKKVNGVWYYYDKGSLVKNAWRKDSTGQWCYLGADGKQAVNTWVKDKGYWYYIKPNGYMASGEWVNWRNNWYYLEAGGKMATGKRSIEHVFESSGKCIK